MNIGYIAGALTTIAFSPPASKSPNFEIYKKCISYDAALLDFRHDPLAISWNFDQGPRTGRCKQYFHCTCLITSLSEN